MSWQAYRFAWLHAAADAGLAALTASVSLDASGSFPKDHSIDYRPNTLTRLAAAQTAFNLTLDRGAGTLEAVDQLVIPAGHNFDGATLTPKSSTTGAWAGEETSHGATVVSGTGVIAPAWTNGSTTQRYLRLSVTAAPSRVYEWGSLYFTHGQVPARGLDPSYSDLPVPRANRERTPSGIISTVFGVPVRAITARVHRLSGADLAVFDGVAAHAALGLPFWYWRTDSALAPLYVTGEFSARSQDRESPQANGETWEVDFSLLEVG